MVVEIVLFEERILGVVKLLLYAGHYFYLLMPPNLILSSLASKWALNEPIWKTLLVVDNITHTFAEVVGNFWLMVAPWRGLSLEAR